MTNAQIEEVVDFLTQLKGEPDVNKRFKEKADNVISCLQENSDMAVEKALIALDEMNSLDLSSYFRTQVWDVISLLESTKADNL